MISLFIVIWTFIWISPNCASKSAKNLGSIWTQMGFTFTLSRMQECERMNPHTPKWTPTLGVGVPTDFWIFKDRFEGSKLIDWKNSYTIGNLLRRRCLKWAHMIHLSTYNINYGWKKDRESKCQFDSQPLKVGNPRKNDIWMQPLWLITEITLLGKCGVVH